MIFTHIFRYLDDRDAEEIKRRSTDNPDNSRSPAADCQSQDSTAEQGDVKFGHSSLKGAQSLVPGGTQPSMRSKTLSSAQMCQGFSTLRAETRQAPKPTTANRVLPPIGKTQMTIAEEHRFVDYDKNTAKLPPIDSLTCKAGLVSGKARSCSKKNEETFCKKATTSAKQKQRRRLQASYDDMLLANSGMKNAFYQHNAKRLDTEATKERVESTQTDMINAAKTSNYLISRQFETHNTYCDSAGSRSQHNKPKTEDLHKSLGLSEFDAQTERLSVEPDMEAIKTRCNSSPCVPSAEYLRLHESSSRNHVRASLVTNTGKEAKSTKLRLVTCDKGRRNAICEVLEKTTVPEYGSSLYDMRQNLMSSS